MTREEAMGKYLGALAIGQHLIEEDKIEEGILEIENAIYFHNNFIEDAGELVPPVGEMIPPTPPQTSAGLVAGGRGD